MRTLVGVVTLAVVMTAGGAVARQALDLRAGTFVAWTCPACGTGNAAPPGERSQAVCCRCRARFEWWDVFGVMTGDRAGSSVAAR